MMSLHICVLVYKKDKHDPDIDIARLYILLPQIESHVQTQLYVSLRNGALFMLTWVICSIPVGEKENKGIPASFVKNKRMFNVEIGYSTSQVSGTQLIYIFMQMIWWVHLWGA